MEEEEDTFPFAFGDFGEDEGKPKKKEKVRLLEVPRELKS